MELEEAILGMEDNVDNDEVMLRVATGPNTLRPPLPNQNSSSFLREEADGDICRSEEVVLVLKWCEDVEVSVVEVEVMMPLLCDPAMSMPGRCSAPGTCADIGDGGWWLKRMLLKGIETYLRRKQSRYTEIRGGCSGGRNTTDYLSGEARQEPVHTECIQFHRAPRTSNTRSTPPHSLFI